MHKLISNFIVTGIALLIAAYIVPGFILNLDNLTAFLALTAIVTLINVLIKPLIKFVLTPLIILTLGLFNLVITGGLLYIVDIYSKNITISGLSSLIYGTIIISVITTIFSAQNRIKY